MKPTLRIQAVNNRYYWVLHTVDKSLFLGPVCKELSVEHVRIRRSTTAIAIDYRSSTYRISELMESQKTCRVGLLQ
jgi:hypothetical protein